MPPTQLFVLDTFYRPEDIDEYSFNLFFLRSQHILADIFNQRGARISVPHAYLAGEALTSLLNQSLHPYPLYWLLPIEETTFL